jgi:hypothetical protein
MLALLRILRDSIRDWRCERRARRARQLDAAHRLLIAFDDPCLRHVPDIDIDAIYRTEQDPEEVARRMRRVLEG